jgi:hypothetical protein
VRSNGLYVLVVVLGYGHLIGGALFGLARVWMRAPVFASSIPGMAFALSLLGTAFAGYLHLIWNWPIAAVPFLVLSVWHAVENDLAWAPDPTGGLSVRGWAPVAPTIGLAAGVIALFVAAVPAGSSEVPAWREIVGLRDEAGWIARAVAVAAALWMLRRPATRTWGGVLGLAIVLLPFDVSGAVGFVEVFAAWTLYHVVSWLFVSVGRIAAVGTRPSTEKSRRKKRLLVAHAIPGLVALSVLAAPVSWDHPLRVTIFAPSIYLFWASLHVVQTALGRVIDAGGYSRVSRRDSWSWGVSPDVALARDHAEAGCRESPCPRA